MDAPNAYLSIRVDKRDAFLHNLDAKKKKRVEHEIERIRRTRKNFSSYEKKKDLMKKLAESRIAWKSEVVHNHESFIRKIVKDHRRYGHDDEECHCQRHIDLLYRLASWEQEVEAQGPSQQRPQTQTRPSVIDKIKRRKPENRQSSQWLRVLELTVVPEQTEQSELLPMYGIRASAMYFKLSGSTWKGYDYPGSQSMHIGKFPRQKISVHDLLERTENNPLSEPCPKGHIRWFHFPANNMCWIEVSSCALNHPKQTLARLCLMIYIFSRQLLQDTIVKTHKIITTALRIRERRGRQTNFLHVSFGAGKCKEAVAVSAMMRTSDTRRKVHLVRLSRVDTK